MYTIYTIENVITGKLYLGQTISDPNKRWREHKWALRHTKHKNPHLQSAWNKYGEDSFKFEVWDTARDLIELNLKERYYIRLLDLLDEGYNLRMGGDNSRMSTESRKKISAAKTGNQYWRGRLHSEETRKKLSVLKSGRALSEHTKQKLRAVNLGKRLSVEQRTKISRGLIGRTTSTLTKQRIGESNAKTYSGLVDPNGVVFKNLKNLAKFCRDRGLCYSSILAVIHGKRNHHKGWIKYDPDLHSHLPIIDCSPEQTMHQLNTIK